ncbi:glucose-6-phosphate dehydrogenase [Methylophilaceae bacterium]|mgnify:CR=1 FL=1|nr:glucose-6-phosphate dehydrogenase [Methylophilaceae bacterium]|tara:strand:- start:360 stop:1814 length:1455 start_codon:yes stop_codon:yes gene_type:complete
MADNSTLVLFGARGNLSRIKLIPGLFHLDEAGKLSDAMKIVSVGRQNISQDEWENEIKDMLENKFKGHYDLKVFERFIKRNIYHATLPDDSNAFRNFAKLLHEDKQFPKNFAFFLSVRPSDFAKIVDQLAEENLLDEDKYWRRVLIEKPFGTNLKSAVELQESISKHLKENQIYRIDHYLGKSALQNILWTRFTNSILDPIWNNNHIDHIQITNHETLGVGERTQFYDATGALRDMTQSHLLQMLALTTMEKPKTFSPDDIRVEKIKLLKSIKPIPINEINKYAFRAQYKSGDIEKEGHVKGYLEELENNKSVVETYAAIRLYIDNPRWKNIPVYLRTAKRLNQSGTFISIKFKNKETDQKLAFNNWLVFSIQPKESTYFEIKTKIPGLNDSDLRATRLEGMNRLEHDEKIDAYETLMLDLLEGNQSRFLHIDEVKAAWSLIDPIIKYWSENLEKVHQYTAGTSDPKESEIIFENKSQFWRKGN